MPNTFPLTVYTTGEVAKKQQSSTFQYYFRGDVILNSQNLNNRTSNLTFNWVMYCKSSGGAKWNTSNTNYQPWGYIDASVNAGATQSLVVGAKIPSYTTSTSEKVLATYTGDFQHDADGNLSISVVFGWNTGSGSTAQYRPASFTLTGDTEGIYRIAGRLDLKLSSGWVSGTPYIKTSNGWKMGTQAFIKTSNGWKAS